MPERWQVYHDWHDSVFQCACPQNYFGDVCDQYDPMDDCNPRNANGTALPKPCCAKGISDPGCLDFFHLAVCQCAGGWTGSTCNPNVVSGDTYSAEQCAATAVGQDACASSPCQNSGNCVDLADGAVPYQCYCPTGFCGPNCDQQSNQCLANDACTSGPCQNGGTCSSYAQNGQAYWKCTCPAKFFGDS